MVKTRLALAARRICGSHGDRKIWGKSAGSAAHEASGKGFGATLVARPQAAPAICCQVVELHSDTPIHHHPYIVDDIPHDFLGLLKMAPYNEHIVFVDSASLAQWILGKSKNNRLSKSVFKLSDHSIPYLFNISSL